MLNLKSKITLANSDLNSGDFLRMAKQDDGSYLSLENLREVLVGSSPFSVASNLDWNALNKQMYLN